MGVQRESVNQMEKVDDGESKMAGRSCPLWLSPDNIQALAASAQLASPFACRRRVLVVIVLIYGNLIFSVEPPAEVNQLASLAAKGEVPVRREGVAWFGSRFFADRAEHWG
jgi:hypothetical protein